MRWLNETKVDLTKVTKLLFHSPTVFMHLLDFTASQQQIVHKSGAICKTSPKHQKMKIRPSAVKHSKLADRNDNDTASSVLLDVHVNKNAVVMGETATPTSDTNIGKEGRFYLYCAPRLDV